MKEESHFMISIYDRKIVALSSDDIVCNLYSLLSTLNKKCLSSYMIERIVYRGDVLPLLTIKLKTRLDLLPKLELALLLEVLHFILKLVSFIIKTKM